MYKLLIVEDEPIERQAIRLMISKNCPEIAQIEEAQDGYSALDICRRFSPDIVMLDINMPGMSGLDTIREIQARTQVHAKFLILSSYDRFDYAREAIQLGVEDFLLKPAKISRIKEALEQCIAKIQSERQHKKESTTLLGRIDRIRPIVESDCVYALISGDEKALLDTFFSFLDVRVQSGFCLAVFRDRMPQLLLARLKKELRNLGVIVIGQRYNDRLVFFVLSEGALQEREPLELAAYLRLYLAQNEGQGYEVEPGLIYEGAASLHLSYRDAKAAHHAVKAKPAVETGNPADLKRHWTTLEPLLLKKDTPAEQLTAFSEAIVLGQELRQARETLYRLLVLAAQCAEEHGAAVSPAPQISMEDISAITNPRDLARTFTAQLRQLADLLHAGSAGDAPGVAGEALRYIDEAYCTNLTLEDVAGHLQITPNYLSRVLKKQTGRNFIDLITDLRIKKAKQLLRENLSIKEVTYQVGFNSQNYFTKSFKKAVGVTPTEYKSEHRQG